MDNGIVQVTLTNPDGIVTGIRYNGVDSLLEVLNKETNRGFIMLRGSSGFYPYGIYEHLNGWPDFDISETRITFKLRKDKFQYMAMADNRQRVMPFPEDRLPGRCQTLGYPEAVLLVDDKYQYSCVNMDNRVHGWISFSPPVGFWQITPSDEFRSGGPLKQNLTSHVGPTALAMFLSGHYVGQDLVPKFRGGESWKKVFGPVYMYLNSGAVGDDPLGLWEDAKIQPYSFPASEDFLKLDQWGNVSGRLLVFDRYICTDLISANGAYVGLAPPGDAGSWQRECKVPGFVGDYKFGDLMKITSGSYIELGELVYEPLRDGPTLWEIGIPDRSAAEFYAPDPNPQHINKLFINHLDRFGQYGLWDGYSELYPDGDLVYTIGVSDYTKDWFYAQAPRITLFNEQFGKSSSKSAVKGSAYKLRIRVNDANARQPVFTSGLIGRDNSIARHGIQGIYWLYNVNIPGSLLIDGTNTIYFSQPRCTSSFQVMSIHVQVVMENGMLKVTLSNPEGIVTGIQYNDIDNLLEVLNDESNRGYWDLVWSSPTSTGTSGTFDVIKGTTFKVMVENEDQVELSFTRTWDVSLEGKLVPLNIDKRFVMLRGSSGFYSYAIYEHLEDWPAFNLDETRIAFKLRKDKFHYMAMADNRQRNMPLPDDRLPPKGKALAYPEAVLLVNPIEPELKGEVDDKYQYSCDNKDSQVHGWICMDPAVGFWLITPSNEFRSGGPLKQNLTSHVGPTTLAVFLSAHYSGEDLVPKFYAGEAWKKVFGPVFIYLNSPYDGSHPLKLWEDAKLQMLVEVQSWPYSFPESENFAKWDERGNVSGRLLVRERYINDDYVSAKGAYVGLAPPGDVGSWQRECKFWAKADDDGYFSISNIRAGDYNVFAWVPGFIGDYKYDIVMKITEGCDIDLGDLVYEPPRDGPTLWEIGIPDRSAAEFYVPDPNPKYINKLYFNHPDKFRQYGLWERYAELYPDKDLIYTVGVSDYTKDWFFAQVTRKKDDNTYQGTTWQIKFKLDNVNKSSSYKLRVALASAALSELQVRVNNPKAPRPLFSSGLIGRDNSIARHGIHGLYWLYNVDMPGTQLVEGDNTIFLTQTRGNGPFQAIMYDYIRLEGVMQISFIKIKKKSDADKSKRTRNSEATFVIKQSPKRANPMQKTMDFSIRFLFLMLQFLIVLGCATKPGVRLDIQDKHVIMDNGIVQVNLSNPEGIVTGIQYNGIDNLLEVLNDESNRGYWDIVWDEGGKKRTKKGAKGKGRFDRMEATNFTVIVESEEQVELSFSRTWNDSLEGKLPPLNIDKRFIMLSGSSGFYTYAIYEHLKEWPAFDLDNTRIAFKPRKDKFHYMVVADNRQRFMPLPDDRSPPRGQVLAYPEAVRLVDPLEPEFKGEVDDKYQYACESRYNRVHGWICIDPVNSTGFWLITPSYEFRSAGPLKQYLTSHVGPTTLSVFHSTHYSGADLIMQFGPNEPWKKVYGPIFIYLNSLSNGFSPIGLWEDAKQQMVNEVESWPYTFPASEDFLSSDQRGKVEGRLLVRDRYISDAFIPVSGAYVGLAAIGEVGSWQRECKGYQFWTITDDKGYFSIINIRPGGYNLYSWVNGFIGDYQFDSVIYVTSGCETNVGELVYEAPRDGPTLWEIGIPDRSAAEFYVPDPNPMCINRLYVNHPDRFRQYGLWERYAELYPNEDLVYTVGISDYRKDWFFAQVNRKKDNGTYIGTTWQINFKLDSVNTNGTYTLQVALASVHSAELEIRINNLEANPPLFSSGVIGKENTIARHGIHGLYWLFSIHIQGTLLVQGNNTIFLTQTRDTSPFIGIMYDYIRLEYKR
ncbi:Rhamnogalacturonate lyase [Glycine max]|nr:Rhamnogalacturonate lyase [Glycine max]